MEEVLRQAARDRKVWRIQEHPGSTPRRCWSRSPFQDPFSIFNWILPESEFTVIFYCHQNHWKKKYLDPGSDQAQGDPEKGHMTGCSFLLHSPSFHRGRTDGGRMRGRTDSSGLCHVGVYLSTTTGPNTSRAEPGQGQ